MVRGNSLALSGTHQYWQYSAAFESILYPNDVSVNHFSRLVNVLDEWMTEQLELSAMDSKEWREAIGYGVGGLLLFIVAGFATVKDILSFIGGRPLMVIPPSRHTPGGDMAIY